MSLTVQQLVSLVDTCLNSYQDASNPIAAARAHQLRNIRAQLVKYGFPTDVDRRCRFSLLPFIFQEANYDDLDWSKKDGNLGHLTDLFYIDLAMSCESRSHSELTDTEYHSYFESGLRCISRWQRRDLSLRAE